MAAPPFDAGAVNAMLALAFPGVTAPMVGAPGTVTVDPPLLDPPPLELALPEVPSPPQPDRPRRTVDAKINRLEKRSSSTTAPP
jgi:hypothetical protein